MLKKIIFFVETPFTKRDYSRYGLEILKSLGHRIEVWNFGFFLKSTYNNNHIPENNLKDSFIKQLNSKSNINNYLSTLNKTDVVLALITVSNKSNFIFNYLNASNTYYGFSLVNTIPVSIKALPLNKRFLRFLKNPLLIINKFYNIYNDNFSLSIKPNFLILGGACSLDLAKKRGFLSKDVKLIKTHTRDYDLFLENRSLNKTLKEDYILFLDEFSPYHPDTLFSGNEVDCTPETYYPDINIFFNKIENQLNMKVIIASHPRANYDQIGNPYGGRQIIKDQTVELVKNSKLILSHASTAINFAILYYKPLIFLTSSQYSNFYQHSINCASQTLGKKPIDISKDIEFNFSDFIKFDKNSYNQFKDQYIKMSDSVDTNQWKIFSNFINNN